MRTLLRYLGRIRVPAFRLATICLAMALPARTVLAEEPERAGTPAPAAGDPASPTGSIIEDGSATDELDDLKARLEALEARMDETGGKDFRVFWNRGLRFESGDGVFEGGISGRINLDGAALSGDRDLDAYVEGHGDDLEDGIEFRRVRLTLKGRIHGRYLYKMGLEFSGGDVEFKDVYVGIDDLASRGMVRAGHFKEPFGFDSVTSSFGLRFLERSPMQKALTPGRNTGLGYDAELIEDRMGLGAGVFLDADGYGDARGDGDLSATARITGVPFRENDRTFLHVGGAYSRRGEDEARFRGRSGSRSAPYLLDTDGFLDLDPHAIEMDAADLYGAEALGGIGPFAAQAEYVRVDVDGPRGADPTFSGWYVEAGYFLTGEQRPYDARQGRVEAPRPEDPFLEGGPGAIELAFRRSGLDLSDHAALHGGRLDDYTLGLNWYLDEAASLSLNLIHSHVESVGSARMAVLRLALNF